MKNCLRLKYFKLFYVRLNFVKQRIHFLTKETIFDRSFLISLMESETSFFTFEPLINIITRIEGCSLLQAANSNPL